MQSSKKKKVPPFSARPFLEPSYLLADSRPEIDRASARDRVSGPGRAFGPDGSGPAAAVRVSARHPAVDLASARGSGSAGRDSGSDWTLRSPFFKVAEGQLWNLPLVARKLGFPRPLFRLGAATVATPPRALTKNYLCTSS